MYFGNFLFGKGAKHTCFQNPFRSVDSRNAPMAPSVSPAASTLV
jgi:hypothetical protein